MLEQIGFSVNVLFGLSSSVNCWSEISSAEFNILISAWTGLKTMDLLKKHFGTPYFHYPIFPIGAHECSEFLREVANFCELDMNLVNQFIEKKEAMFYYYMERLTEMLTRYDSTFPQRFFTIGESTYVSGITRFLVKELGMIPGCQYIVDDPPYKYRNKIENSCKSIPSEISLTVTFVNDGEEIIKSIKEKAEDLIPLIIGSSWDSIIASKLKGYFISMSPPISDRLILNKSYIGYEGGLAFIEDIFSCILRGL